MSGPIFFVRWLTLAGWLFWFVVYWKAGLRIVADIRKAAEASHSRLDPLLMVAMTLLSPIPVLTGVLIGLGKLKVSSWLESEPVVFISAAMSLVGMVGTFYCRHHLGRFWTAEATLLSEHQIVDSGPYGVVRHPIYACALPMYAGTAIVFPTWWNVVACGLVMLSYVLKAKVEDKFLAESLPGYEEYQGRVRYRLMPWVW